MTAARWWGAMAIASPIVTLLLGLAGVPAGRAFLYDVVECEWGVAKNVQGLVLGGFGVLNLAIAMTFVTDALGRKALPFPARVLWCLAILCASPLAIPGYWYLYLGEPSERA